MKGHKGVKFSQSKLNLNCRPKDERNRKRNLLSMRKYLAILKQQCNETSESSKQTDKNGLGIGHRLK